MTHSKATLSARSSLPAAPVLSRRGLFQLGAVSAALVASPLAARGFGSGFTHGVASGEPGQGRVLLWTRFVAEQDTPLDWQVSESEDFSRPISEGRVMASPHRDWCCKTWANGLKSDAWYYYRFVAPDGSVSITGRTRTLPAGRTEKFRMAVFSCSNFGFGWFNSYAHAAQANDADLAVHLGDYIYEYGRGTYPSADAANPHRVLWPDHESIVLADYRLRYATYRTDPDLRRLHQVMPMVAVWDDHEAANDSWENGAQNHQAETEGDWAMRKAAAKQAYREWMPVSDEPYAQYELGDLATLFRLDTRLEGREEQFDLGTVLKGKTDPQSAIAALSAFKSGEWANPERQLLGQTQEDWLFGGMATSRSAGKVWQVLAQQVLVGELRSPPAILSLIADDLPQSLRQLVLAAAAANAAGLPSNMDAWDGYPGARSRLLAAAQNADANLLVLAGDTHNGWAFELEQDGARAGVEFGVPGVTSPGLETSLSGIAPSDFAKAAVDHNAQLVWADTSQRGYMNVELTPESATTEMRFVGTVKTRSIRLASTKRLSTQAGSQRVDV